MGKARVSRGLLHTRYLESTLVFKSRKNSWQATSCLPPHFLLWGRRISAYYKGFLYCVAPEIGGMNTEGLIAYNVNSNMLNLIEIISFWSNVEKD
uniref:Uncharacterized protein n=1 Tax=Physcomitrium patens TaxID=3218 RepID=A0A2K1IMT3_PHYPA|nr:hypothetical protein PHYPA_026902 [Physcomitrium patens]